MADKCNLPSPFSFSQELYLGSLAALGIDTRSHDVRFVEDNWESPVLGAWGLGWEVWLDGMEVTQFTYFQQAGGLKYSCRERVGSAGNTECLGLGWEVWLDGMGG